MRRQSVTTAVGAVALLAGTACGGALDDLARLASQSPADEATVRTLVSREAAAMGASSDDTAKQWIARFKGAASTYQDIDPALRAATCDVVTGWAGALVTPDTQDDLPAVDRVAGAIANLNQYVSSQRLARDLSDAKGRQDAGEPVYLRVLLQTAVCQAAG